VGKKETWEIILTRPAEKVYDRSGRTIKTRLESCFADLEKDPLYSNNIKPLVGKLKGLYRYRIGDLRIIYRLIKESRIDEIIAILPRGNAY
jgi:mRNA interferase RelE/StbE